MTEPTSRQVQSAWLDRTDRKPPKRRWLLWPWCAGRRHPARPGKWCACRGVVSFQIIKRQP